MRIPLWRRFAIAFVALILAGGLFHTQLASALVTRGDNALRNGDVGGAARYYRRALYIDAHCTVAADRLAFNLDMRRSPEAARAAIEVSSTALNQTPDSADLLADRAWAEQYLGRWMSAQHDFALAGAVANDPRYDHFAGRIALVRGRRLEARHFFRLALVRDKHFDPARAALAGLQ